MHATNAKALAKGCHRWHGPRRTLNWGSEIPAGSGTGVNRTGMCGREEEGASVPLQARTRIQVDSPKPRSLLRGTLSDANPFPVPQEGSIADVPVRKSQTSYPNIRFVQSPIFHTSVSDLALGLRPAGAQAKLCQSSPPMGAEPPPPRSMASSVRFLSPCRRDARGCAWMDTVADLPSTSL